MRTFGKDEVVDTSELNAEDKEAFVQSLKDGVIAKSISKATAHIFSEVAGEAEELADLFVEVGIPRDRVFFSTRDRVAELVRGVIEERIAEEKRLKEKKTAK